MTFERRAFLRAGASCVLAAAMPRIALASTPLATPPLGRDLRSVKFENLHTGERLAADYYVNGRYDPAVLQAVNNVLRDYRTGDVYPIDPRLLDLLHDLNGRLETPVPYQVISGYRSPRTNEMLHERSSGVASKSLHTQGMAIDIRIPGRALSAVHDTALAMGRGGVGMYPTSNFVHVDVGRVRKWTGV
jgi:uncharacterized protein YcbK (DUF882 family)